MNLPPGTDPSSLTGLRILVVEDMYLIADELADQLSGWGCQVIGPEGRVKGALERIDGVELDGALLDINLDGEKSFEIASVLASRDVPFIFLTGYDRDTALPDEFRSAPKLAKPISAHVLAREIGRHFGR